MRMIRTWELVEEGKAENVRRRKSNGYANSGGPRGARIYLSCTVHPRLPPSTGGLTGAESVRVA